MKATTRKCSARSNRLKMYEANLQIFCITLFFGRISLHPRQLYLIFLIPFCLTPGLQYAVCKSQRGKDLLIVGNYTFAQKNKHNWSCSNNKCKAKLKLDDQNHISHIYNEHNHVPRKFVVTPDGNYVRDWSRVGLQPENKTYEIMTSSRGSEMILFQGHTFSKAYKCTKGSSYAWRCSKKDTKCKAMVKLNDDGELTICNSEHTHQMRDRPKIKNITFEEETDKTYEMVTTGKGGELLLVSKFQWVCSTKNPLCRAKLKMVDGVIFKIVNQHCHPAGRIYYEVVKSQRGKTLILVDGYTFSQTSTYFWVCSTRLPGCKAKLRLENGFITDINNFHSHPSRKYVKSQKGTYVRVG
ncbi:hypothetical protein ABMA28_001404 [Loxostege sticticalis]|uniref:FLYWCH-type domain-containing protein n=1 Tax=Loxostege sticticalis TaxID=481309 RepID=A0ABD0T1J7_LOXSC